MAYQALYRKYRPNTFDDFIDQDNIKQTLINSIRQDKIKHAYLFSGPRGIGKTSMAKIFAKAINCFDFNKKSDVCDKCENCKKINDNSVDIVEIDAASNNGVDQIRDLKNKISIVPSELKYKVYIIDEVHMLTNSAFNALLKTLEEPPSYVVFILATTEFYEVPETIVSRCQCFNFNRISLNSLVNRLELIAKNEKIDISKDAINDIAVFANGGLRDAIGMLDKISSFVNGKITSDDFKKLNGMISQEDVVDFYESILEKNVSKVLDIINKVNENGYDYSNFIERTMILTRDKILNYYISNESINSSIDNNISLVDCLNNIITQLKNSINPVVIVQIYVLRFINNISREMINESEIISQEIKNNKKSNDKIISREIKKDDLNNQDNISREMINKSNKNNTIIVNESIKNIRINNSLATASKKNKTDFLDKWDSLSNYFMDEKFGKIAQLLSDTSPMVVGTNYMIFVARTEGIIDNIYANLLLAEQLISIIYHKISMVLLLENEFESVKEKYIEDQKNKIVYQEQEECGTLLIESNDLADKLVNMFGKDYVDIE